MNKENYGENGDSPLDSWAPKKDLLEIAWEARDQVKEEIKLKLFENEAKFHREFNDVLLELYNLNKWFNVVTTLSLGSNGEFLELKIQDKNVLMREMRFSRNGTNIVLYSREPQQPQSESYYNKYAGSSILGDVVCSTGFILQREVVKIFQNWFDNGFKLENVKGFKNV